jgi:hypothetical protein
MPALHRVSPATKGGINPNGKELPRMAVLRNYPIAGLFGSVCGFLARATVLCSAVGRANQRSHRRELASVPPKSPPSLPWHSPAMLSGGAARQHSFAGLLSPRVCAACPFLPGLTVVTLSRAFQGEHHAKDDCGGARLRGHVRMRRRRQFRQRHDSTCDNGKSCRSLSWHDQ